jgi:nicotinate phosphoribosyltransferase
MRRSATIVWMTGGRADRRLGRRHRPGTSRDSPTVNGVYKLVAHQVDGRWRGVFKTSPGKATVPGAKQVFRRYEVGTMRGDLIAPAGEHHPGEPLLVPAVREGELVHEESRAQVRDRAQHELAALPAALRALDRDADDEPCPVARAGRPS